jgi:hypothetical protein
MDTPRTHRHGWVPRLGLRGHSCRCPRNWALCGQSASHSVYWNLFFLNFIYSFIYLFWWYWRLNFGPHAC